jgi:hypothetical protein
MGVKKPRTNAAFLAERKSEVGDHIQFAVDCPTTIASKLAPAECGVLLRFYAKCTHCPQNRHKIPTNYVADHLSSG